MQLVASCFPPFRAFSVELVTYPAKFSQANLLFHFPAKKLHEAMS